MSAYYGDPEVLKLFNKNIESLVGASADFEAQVALYDSMVVQELEGDLSAIYDSWPDPNGKQQNSISLLWVYGMSALIQSTKTATQRSGSGSVPGDNFQKKYNDLLGKLKKGQLVVPGAIAGTGSLPGVKAYTANRVFIRDAESPRDVGDLMPHGLRLTNPDRGTN